MNRGFQQPPPLLPPAVPRGGNPPALPAASGPPRPSNFTPGPTSTSGGARPAFPAGGASNFNNQARPSFSGVPPAPAPSSATPAVNGSDPKKGLPPVKEEVKKGPVINQQRLSQIQHPTPQQTPHSSQSHQQQPSPHQQPPYGSQSHQPPAHQSFQTPPLPGPSQQAPPLPMIQGQKRFSGPPIESTEKKFRISPPGQQATPAQIAQLRVDLSQKINHTPPQEMAAVVCSAVTGSCRDITDQFAMQLLEATFGNINRYLQPDTKLNLPMFADRVGAALRTELTNFFEKTFQTELVQLLLASTHQQPNVDALLRHKAMEIVHNLADPDALNGVRAQLDRPQTRSHAPPQPEPQQFAPPPTQQSFQPPQSFQQPPPQQQYQFQQPPPQQGFQQQPQPSHPQAQPPQYGAPPFIPQQQQPPVKASTPQMETQLCNAALSGELVTVQSILRQGVNINASQEGGWTALMNATLQGHLPVVKTLIDEKADLDLKDHGGFTALMYAASYNRVQIAEELVKAGANLDVTDNSGRNISHYANDPQIKAAIGKGQQDREAAKSSQMQGMPQPHMMQMGVGPQAGMQQSMMGMQGYRR